MMAVFFVLLFVADRGASPEGGSATELYLIALVTAVALLRATRLRVRIDDAGVTAYTLIRTRRVPWEDLAGVAADARGLVLLRVDGPPVLVQSLGETAPARILRPRTSGTAVAEAIDDERARHTP